MINVRRLLYPDPDRAAPLGLLLLRAAPSLLIIPHGLLKAAGDVNGLAAGLAAKGLPAATLLAWCATLSELVGGLLVLVGLLARPAAAAVSFTMVVAWSSAHLPQAAQIGTGQGVLFEYAFLMSLLFAALAVSGPGRYSLDARLFGSPR